MKTYPTITSRIVSELLDSGVKRIEMRGRFRVTNGAITAWLKGYSQIDDRHIDFLCSWHGGIDPDSFRKRKLAEEIERRYGYRLLELIETMMRVSLTV